MAVLSLLKSTLKPRLNNISTNFDVNEVNNGRGSVNSGSINPVCLSPEQTSVYTSSLTMITTQERKTTENLSVSGSARNGIRLRLGAIQEENNNYVSAPSNFI